MKDLKHMNFAASVQIFDDFPELQSNIEEMDDLLAEYDGLIIKYDHIYLTSDSTHKELTLLLKAYSAHGVIQCGMASYCYTHNDTILDEEGYCYDCNTIWIPESIKLEKVIKII